MAGMPDPVVDERAGLLSFLGQQRYVIHIAAHGLTDEQAGLSPTAGPLSIGGLIKHVTSVERHWMGIVLQRPYAPSPDTYEDTFAFRPGMSLADALADYEQAGRETEDIVAGIADLGQPVPIPKGVPWFPAHLEAWSVRWVLLHLIEETARHAGHADIVRETIDGATAFPLLAAVEGWPETPWITPWRLPVES